MATSKQDAGAGDRASGGAVGGPLVGVDWKDDDGLWWRVWVPADKPEDGALGIPVGPPDTSPLGLPVEVQRRLHNQLHRRGLITKRDLRGRAQEVVAALQVAYRVDAVAVMALYE